LWGAVFASLFGRSYESLRASVLVLAFVGAWAVARGSRAYGAPRWACLAAGAVVLFNPDYVNLAYTFMSDVPLFTLVALAGWCYLRALDRQSAWHVVLGTVLGVSAFFVRQHGFGVVLAFWATAVVLLAWPGHRLPRRMWVALAASTAVGLIAIVAWSVTHPLSASQTTWLNTLNIWSWSMRLSRMGWFGFVSLVYMAFFTMPLLAALALQRIRLGIRHHSAWWSFVMAATAVFGFVTVFLSPGMTRLPYLSDYLYDLGVGGLTFTGTSQLARDWKPISVGKWWWLVTLPALAFAGMFVVESIRRIIQTDEQKGDRSPHRRDQTLFLCTWMAAYIVGYMPFLPRAMGERYILTALAPAAILAAGFLTAKKAPFAQWAAWGLVTVLAVFSLAAQHDFMAMTRARWAATDWLIQNQHVDPLQIDGGYEYNGVHTMDTFLKQHHVTAFHEQGDRGYWLIDPVYAVDLIPRQGYQEIHRFAYFTWLDWRQRDVIVFRRDKTAP